MTKKRGILENDLVETLDAHELDDKRRKDSLVDAIARSRKTGIEDILADLPGIQLKSSCRALPLDASSNAKTVIVPRLTGSNGGRSTRVESEVQASQRSRFGPRSASGRARGAS